MAANAMPCLASKALLAVTTDFLAASAADTAVRAGSPSPHQFHEHVDLAISRERHGISDPAQLPVTNIAFLAAERAGCND
jgi:hypothetical protein